MYNPMARRGIGEQTEKEMLTVVIVPAEKADEIFAYIYELAEIGEPHHGIIFQSDLLHASDYQLPEKYRRGKGIVLNAGIHEPFIAQGVG